MIEEAEAEEEISTGSNSFNNYFKKETPRLFGGFLFELKILCNIHTRLKINAYDKV